MTELSLILAIAIVGLALSGYLARWLLMRPLGDAEMNRVANLVRAACESFMRRQSSTVLAMSGLATGSLFLAYGLRRVGPEAISRLETGVWLTVSCAVGAASVIVIAQVATFFFTRTTVRVASGARRSVDQSLVIGLRGGAVVGILSSTLATLGSAGLVLAILTYHGALSQDLAGAALVSPLIPTLVTGFPLGAGFAALLYHLAGGVFAKASDIGSDVGGREAGLSDDDPDNPAAVANLAGDGVGECVGHATGSFAAATAEDLAAMLVGAAVFQANASMRSAITVILLPIVARSFGVLAALFGVMVVRTDEREKPESAIFRGFSVAAVLQAVGFIGTAKWLLPGVWREVAAASILGVVGSFALSPIVQQFTMVRARVREIAEASRAGPGINVLSGIVAGLDAAVGPVLVACVLVSVGYAIGAHTGLERGGLFGVTVTLVCMGGVSPYLTSVAAASTAIDAAGGVVVMSVGRERPDVRGRLLVLDTIGTSQKSFARAHGSVLGAVALILFVDAVESALRDPTNPAVTSIASPATYLGVAFGLLLPVWLLARSTSGVTRCARRIVEEVRRQLGGRGEARATRVDHAPCIEIAARFSLRHVLLHGLTALVVPVLVVVGLRLVARPPLPGTAATAVSAFSFACGIAALGLSLTTAGLGAAFSNAKRYILTGAHGGRLLADEAGGKAENPTFHAASVGDTVGDALKDAGVPSAQLLARLVPVIALVVAPFLA